MATVAFGIIGGAIGAWVDPANPAQGAMWGWALGTTVGGLLFPPNMPATSLGKLDDLRVSSGSYGTFIPQIWGQFRVAGQYIWSTPLQQQTQNSSGKGGVSIYTYTASFAVLLCRGPVKSIGRIWMNDMIVYDPNVTINTIPETLTISGAGHTAANGTYTLSQSSLTGSLESNNLYSNGYWRLSYYGGQWVIYYSPTGSTRNSVATQYYTNSASSSTIPSSGWVHVLSGYGTAPTVVIATYEPITATTASSVTIEGMYLGTREQSQDPLMTASLSAAGNPNPAYKGYCYIVFENVVLTNYGNRLPNIQVEVFGYGSTVAEVIYDINTQAKLIPNSLQVSGGGSTGVNGTYVPVPIPSTSAGIEGYNCWSNGTYLLLQISLTVDTFEWSICTISGASITTYYNNTSDSLLPPTTGWTVGAGAGSAPILTILNGTGDYDISLATQPVIGYCNGSSQMGKAALELLLIQNYMDTVEADGQMKYIPRGSTPIRILTDDDIGITLWDSGSQQDSTVPLKYRRQQPWELPTCVQVNYYQYNADIQLCNYLQAMQPANRTTINTQQNLLSYTFPSVMSDETAAQLAQLLLYTAWIEAETYSTNVGMRNIDLMPTDIIQVNSGGQNRRVRIIKDDMNLPGIQELSFVADDWSVLSQYVQGGTTGGIAADSITSSGIPIAWLAFQCNAFTSDLATDGDVHIYLGASWQAGGNNQCIIYVSLDNGNSWILVTTLASTIIMGPCTNTLGAWYNPTVTDTSNTLNVYIENGELLSCSSADLVNGKNMLYVGGEIIQYQTATSLGGNTYALTNLLRGQKGTFDFMLGHTSGEMAITLDDNLGIYKTLPNPYGSGPALSSTLIFKFVFTGNSSSYEQYIQLNAPEWMCYPVSGVSASRSTVVIG